MRILEVYKDVHPFTRGGIERYIYDLSGFLARNGHEVQVLIAGDTDAGVNTMDQGFSIVQTPCICRILSNPVCPDLTNTFKTIEADVVHFHLPLPSAVISWMLSGRNTPYIVTYHSDIVRQALFLPIYGPFLRSFLRKAYRILATSEIYRNTSVFLRDLDNVTVVPIGVDLSRFTPKATEPSRDYFLFVGRFRQYKGIHVLLDAWRHFPAKRLVMVGGGPLHHRIVEAISRWNLNIEIVSDPDDDALVSLYRNARCLILPSTLRSEAFGMVQTEAMACGTPVISTSIGTGVSWVNSHGVSGLIVEPDDPEALAEAIIRMEDPALHAVYAKGALERAMLEFDSNRLFEEIESMLAGMEAESH